MSAAAAAMQRHKAAAASAGGRPEDRLSLDTVDLDNAVRLEMAYGHALAYVEGRGWACWTGLCWDFELGRHHAKRCASQLRDLVTAEARAAASMDVDDVAAQRWIKRQSDKRQGELALLPPDARLDEARRAIRQAKADALRKWARSCASRAKIAAAVDLLEPRLLRQRDAFDADPWALHAINGVIDLRAACGEPPPSVAREDAKRWRMANAPTAETDRRAWLLKPDPARCNARVLGVEYDPGADCPEFDAFMAAAFPDREMRGFALRTLALSLHGRNFAQRAIFWLGEGGNGKSTLANLMRHILGTYAAGPKIALFLDGQTENPGAPNPEEIPIIGARALFMSEPKKGVRLAAEKLKTFTGGEPRTARDLQKSSFEYTPHAVPYLSFNRTPPIADDDEGTWRRCEFVLFTVNFRNLPDDRQRDPAELLDALKAEGPGVLNRLLDALFEVRAFGLRPPAASLAVKADKRSDADPVGSFIASMCVDCRADADAAVHHAKRIQAKEFADRFTEWCESNGLKAWAPQTIRRAMSDKQWPKITPTGKTFYIGLRLRSDAELAASADATAPTPPRDLDAF